MNIRNKRTLRRLGHAALFSAVRAAATAAGTAGIGGFLWWLHH